MELLLLTFSVIVAMESILLELKGRGADSSHNARSFH